MALRNLVGRLAHNWRLKLAALALSVFLWALVQTEPRNAETFSSVPVVVDVADTTWALAAPPIPPTVELRLSGPAREIIRLARQGTEVRVPVEAIHSPDTVIVLRREWVRLGEGSGLTVEGISPDAVEVTFEEAVTRTIPLALSAFGALPEHLAFASPIGLTPRVVKIRGPASRVEAMDSVRLRPIDLSAISESGIMEVPVDTAGLGPVRVMPHTATVGVRVEEKVERLVPGVPVLAEGADGEAVRVDPPTVDVTLRGARSLVTAVDARDLRVVVDPDLLRGMVPGEARRVPLRLEGTPALLAAAVNPAMGTVTRLRGSP
ncbi:MAG: CdaR family protein [Gemmatimonadota bacterium]